MFNKLKQFFGANKSNSGDGGDDESSKVQPAIGTGFGMLESRSSTHSVRPGSDAAPIPGSGIDSDELSKWALAEGLTLGSRERGGLSISGKLKGRPWRLEIGRPSRDFIKGDELRARAELKLSEDAVVLLMNRGLKEQLEKRAFSLYTDPLQTTVDPNLPEEMRWLAMFQEFGWEEAGREFFDEFAVLADSRDRAMAWLNPELATQFRESLVLMPSSQSVPDSATPDSYFGADTGETKSVENEQVPMVFMVLRGKAYLRMQHEPATLATLKRAHALFIAGSLAAIDGLSTDLSI